MTAADTDLDGFLFKEHQKTDYTLALKIALASAILLLIAGLVIIKFHKLSLELKKTNRQLEELTVIDQLTQVKNRRGLLEKSAYVLSQARRNGSSCSFLMLDIDNFKRINDNYGHPAGDAALINLAKIISTNRRKHDIVARLGGEEFAILLVDTNLDEAESVAQQILKDIQNSVIQCPNSRTEFSITASIGIALAEGELENFWHKAD